MIDHEDRQVVTVPRWAMLECGGDARDAMVLAQITWWMQPSQRDGSPRTRRLVERNGHKWMHLTDAELATDLGMSRAQVQRARSSLVKRELIASKAAKVDGQKVTLVRPIVAGLREVEESIADRAEPKNQPSREDARSRARASSPCSEPRQETEPLLVVADAPTPGFDDFWAVWPHRRGSKAEAHRAWPAAVRAAGSPLVIVEGARRYAADPNLPEPRFIPHAVRWLRGERWADPPLPARCSQPPVPRQAMMEDRDGPEGRIPL